MTTEVITRTAASNETRMVNKVGSKFDGAPPPAKVWSSGASCEVNVDPEAMLMLMHMQMKRSERPPPYDSGAARA